MGNFLPHGTTNEKEWRALDPVRRRLLRLMADSRTNLRTASLAIERNASYLHQLSTVARPACSPRTTATCWPSTGAAAPALVERGA